MSNDIFRAHPGGILLTKRLLSESGIKPGKILDLGCGYGETASFLQKEGFEVFGADSYEQAVIYAKQHNPDIEFFCVNSHSLPFEDLFFDSVICECTLSVLDKREAFPEISRVLKQRGTLLFSDLCSTTDKESELPTEAEWGKTLEEYGFEPTFINPADSEWKAFVSKVLWEQADISCTEDCFPEIVSFRNISYCYGIAVNRK